MWKKLFMVPLLSACAPSALESGSPDPVDNIYDNSDLGDTTAHPMPSTEWMAAQTRRADAVFVGRVIAVESRMSTPDTDGLSLPFTFVTWEVERGIKGLQSGETFTARLLGGEMPDGRIMEVSNIPRFALGDRDLLLMNDNDREGCPTVDGESGRIPISRASDLGRSSEEMDAWSGQMERELRQMGLTEARAALSKDPNRPFTFDMPKAQ